MAYSVDENNALFSDNAYNKLSIEKYINIHYGTDSFSESLQANEIHRFSSILRNLNAQLMTLEIDSEPFNETIELIKELYNCTNVNDLNNDIQVGKMPEVLPTEIKDKDEFLDLVLLDKFSSLLNYWVKSANLDITNRRIYANPQEVIDKIEMYYGSSFEQLDQDGEPLDSKKRKDLMAQYTHFKSYVSAYRKVESKEARDHYDEEVYGDKLPLMKKEAEYGLLGKNEDSRKAILEQLGIEDPREEGKKKSTKDDKKVDKKPEEEQKESEEKSNSGNQAKTKGSFYYDSELKDYVTDKNDTHSKIRNLFKVSRVGDIDSGTLTFTQNTSDPVRTLVTAKKLTERTASSLDDMPEALRKQYKDYMALPYRWLMAKYDRPILLMDEQDINSDQVVVHHLGTIFTEAFVKEPSEENKDGQIHLSEEELDTGIGQKSDTHTDMPITEAFGVFREDKHGRITHDIVFADVKDDFIQKHKDFFRDVFFSKEFVSLIQQRNASYAGNVTYVPGKDQPTNYRINFNQDQDYIRVGTLRFAELTTEEAMQVLEPMGYSEDQVTKMISKYTQGQMVNVRGVSDYEVKGKKRFLNTLDRMKKRQIDFLLLEDAKKRFPGITDKAAAEMVRDHREELLAIHSSNLRNKDLNRTKTLEVPSFMDPSSPNYYKNKRDDRIK